MAWNNYRTPMRSDWSTPTSIFLSNALTPFFFPHQSLLSDSCLLLSSDPISWINVSISNIWPVLGFVAFFVGLCGSVASTQSNQVLTFNASTVRLWGVSYENGSALGSIGHSVLCRWSCDMNTNMLELVHISKHCHAKLSSEIRPPAVSFGPKPPSELVPASLRPTSALFAHKPELH